MKFEDKIGAEILPIEPKERGIGLFIKQLGRTEDRTNYDRYAGECSKKTSMGDVLGDQLKAALIWGVRRPSLKSIRRKQKMAAMDNSYLMKILFADPLPKSYA